MTLLLHVLIMSVERNSYVEERLTKSDISRFEVDTFVTWNTPLVRGCLSLVIIIIIIDLNPLHCLFYSINIHSQKQEQHNPVANTSWYDASRAEVLIDRSK